MSTFASAQFWTDTLQWHRCNPVSTSNVQCQCYSGIPVCYRLPTYIGQFQQCPGAKHCYMCCKCIMVSSRCYLPMYVILMSFFLHVNNYVYCSFRLPLKCACCVQYLNLVIISVMSSTAGPLPENDDLNLLVSARDALIIVGAVLGALVILLLLLVLCCCCWTIQLRFMM